MVLSKSLMKFTALFTLSFTFLLKLMRGRPKRTSTRFTMWLIRMSRS